MKEIAVKDQRALVQYNGKPITITFKDIKDTICPEATDQEAVIFLKNCQSLNLNPFANEIYLIKYPGAKKSHTVIAVDAYLKASETNLNYNGHEAGIILKDSSGKLEFWQGTFLLDEETSKLVGGWAKVYRKDRQYPFFIAINLNECVKYTKYGKPTDFWTVSKQPNMIRKTALKRGLREAFPSLFSGISSNMEVDAEIIEGELPESFETNGELNYHKFWGKVRNELNLSTEEAHKLLGVESIKVELIEGQGKKLGAVFDMLIEKIKEEKPTEVETETPETDPINPLLPDSNTKEGTEITRGEIQELAESKGIPDFRGFCEQVLGKKWSESLSQDNLVELKTKLDLAIGTK